jgi:hypothetical protein
MLQHEWEEYEFDGGSIGIYTITYCKNCGGMMANLFLNKNGKPPRIRIPGTYVYLPQDCLQSQKMLQTYWEKEGKNKEAYKDYK